MDLWRQRIMACVVGIAIGFWLGGLGMWLSLR